MRGQSCRGVNWRDDDEGSDGGGLDCGGFVAVGIGIGGAQTAKRPMTFADLMAMKRVSDPQVSPSGKWVMFSVTDVSLEKNTKVNHLWVVGLGETGNCRFLRFAAE